MAFGDVLPVKLHASVNDLRGQVFSRLTVIEYESKGRWRCRCECGDEKVVYGDNLEDGLTRSCGCLMREVNAKRMVNVGNAEAKDFVTLAQDALPTACYEELCVMQVDAFNPDARTIHIERSKSGKGRYIPLSDEGVTFFTTEVEDKKPTVLMLIHKDGRQWLVDRTPGLGFRVGCFCRSILSLSGELQQNHCKNLFYPYL